MVRFTAHREAWDFQSRKFPAVKRCVNKTPPASICTLIVVHATSALFGQRPVRGGLDVGPRAYLPGKSRGTGVAPLIVRSFSMATSRLIRHNLNWLAPPAAVAFASARQNCRSLRSSGYYCAQS